MNVESAERNADSGNLVQDHEEATADWEYTATGDGKHATASNSPHDIVEESPQDNLTLVEVEDLLAPFELAADLLHPGDHCMAATGGDEQGASRPMTAKQPELTRDMA